MKKTILLTIIAAFAISCGTPEKIPYMVGAEKIDETYLKNNAKIFEARIMPKDVLQISVNTTIPEAAAPFNLGSSAGSGVMTQGISITGAELQTYIVDNEGFINYPVVGELKVAGMTRVELQNYIRSQIHPQYIKEIPVINVRFKNYKVSVLGEVTRPGTFTLVNEQCTILDALAMAGDLTIYGKRDNVLIIRENSKGEKVFLRIDLQDPYIVADHNRFYLQQNDVVYVEPNKTRSKAAAIGTAETLIISIVSTLISIATLVISIVR